MASFLKSIQLLIFTTIFSIVAMAQEKEIDVNISTDKPDDNFFAQPWVWIVGAALFILLLVALLRGNRSAN